MFGGTGTSVALKRSIEITVKRQISNPYVDVNLFVLHQRERGHIYRHNEDLVDHLDPTIVEDQQIYGGGWFCAYSAISYKFLEYDLLVIKSREWGGTYYKYRPRGMV